MSLTSSPRSSSATASGLPDAALGTVSPGRNEDLPVPAQEMSVHAQGLKTTQGGQGPRDDGPVPVAFCMPRRHRHPRLHCFRRSIPRLYAPLSTLRVLPRGSVPRMTRGQCGSLLLHCNGLSPSTSCRSSRRTAAPVNASRRPSRDAAHHSGSGRMAMGDFQFFASFPGALRSGSIAPVWLSASHFRSYQISRRC